MQDTTQGVAGEKSAATGQPGADEAPTELSATEASQGRPGNRVLKILVASLVLALVLMGGIAIGMIIELDEPAPEQVSRGGATEQVAPADEPPNPTFD